MRLITGCIKQGNRNTRATGASQGTTYFPEGSYKLLAVKANFISELSPTRL